MAIAKNDELFHLTNSGSIVKVKAVADERRGMVSIQSEDEEIQVSSFVLFRTMRGAEIALGSRSAS